METFCFSDFQLDLLQLCQRSKSGEPANKCEHAKRAGMAVILSSAPSRGLPVPIFPPDPSEAVNVFPRCSPSTELIEFGFSRIVTLIYWKQASCTARACLLLTCRCLLVLSLAVAIKACRGFRNCAVVRWLLIR